MPVPPLPCFCQSLYSLPVLSSNISRIAFANFVARRTRFALTIVAVALSVALVVSITSGYASLEHAIRGFVEDFVGSVDFEITRADDLRPAIPPQVMTALRADPRVAKISTRIEAYATPVDSDGRPVLAARMMLFGIEDDPSSLGRPPRMDAGRFLKPGEQDVIVLDQNSLESLNAKLGDTVTFEGRDHPLKLTIVGVIHKPSLMRMFFRSGYLPIGQLGDFVAPDRPGYVSKVRGEFNVNVDNAGFAKDWGERLQAMNDQYGLKLVRDSRADLDRNLLSLRLASFLGSTISLAAAAFIILATLMTGVQEQHRQLAMLRAVGATRMQVARLVCFEGLFIGLSGAILGVPMGIAAVYLLAVLFPHIFDGGVSLAPAGMIYALVVAAAASLLASLVPAYWASRARPLEAMSDATLSDRPSRVPWLAIAAGLMIAPIDSIVIFAPFDRWFHAAGFDWLAQHTREGRLFGHFVLGIPSLLIGALLIAPLVVGIVDRIGQRILAFVLRLPRPLLAQQLSESPWRSAATGVSLMIGLMLLITMNAQGRSALASWKIPTKFPDVFIIPDAGYGSLSIKSDEVEAIKRLPEVQEGKVMPISVTAPTLGAQIFDVAGTKMPDKTLFIGIDPALGFEMMELDFLAHDDKINRQREATAKRMMISGRLITLRDHSTLNGTIESEATDSIDLLLLDGSHRTVSRADILKSEKGRYLIVTNEFRKLRGYDVGDNFQLEAGLFITTKIDFTIVGVVWSPGLDVMLNTFDLPARVKEQTAATVFGTLEDGRSAFGVRDAFLIAANLKMGVPKEELLASIRKRLGREGLTVADIRELKHTIETVFGRILMFASTVAWLAMFVATLGVGNAIVAAIRTRQWRLGVLRSIGLTRSALLRLLLAEALLLSIVGVVLGIIFGIVLANNAKHLYAAALGFDPPLILPWDLIAIASVVVILLGLGATIIPAIGAARRQPLSLLQAGRAAG